jgi:SAM-dependent methyltransferase
MVTPTSTADLYEHAAAFFEAEYGHLERDIAYFARHSVPGPLLVLGCGTGRVGRKLGELRPVTGLDRSEAMLRIARQLAPKARYTLGDMRDFELGTFAEIVIPNGGFAYLAKRSDQQSCLRACHRALEPGAPLTLDLPMPHFGLLGTPHTAERPAWEGSIDGVSARRTREVWRLPVAQRLQLIDRYYLDDALVGRAHLDLRLIFPAEAEWMLEAAGYYVEALHGDYGDKPLSEGSPRLIVRAVRL